MNGVKILLKIIPNIKMNKITVRCIDCHIATIDQKGVVEYLILKRSEKQRYPNIWQCVTGKIKENEKPIDTAKREVKEETGLSPIKMWSIDTVNFYYDHKKNIMNLIPVFGFIVEKNSIKLSSEHQDYKWSVFVDAYKQLLWEQQKKGLEKFNEIISNLNSDKSNILKF